MQGRKLYVGNLSYTVTNEQLRDLFAVHGEVRQVNIIQDKGFGFVEMGTSQDAEKAKTALNGTEFSGRNLKVDEARPPRTGGGGGFGNRGGGGGFGGGRREHRSRF